MPINSFLETTHRDENDFLLISEHRKYQHEEELYDTQYKILPDDYLAGYGLKQLASNLELDLNGTILELGCGTGRLSVGLLSVFDPTRILITDGSSIFLDIAKRKFVDNNLSLPHLGILQFEDIKLLPDREFSLIVIRSALHHVNDYNDFINTCSKKLKNAGALIFQEPLYEGLFIMGLIAKYLQPNTVDPNVHKDLALLSDVMGFYCRNDVDKSSCEDKHVFRCGDILNAANKAGLQCRFFPNRSFEDFTGPAPQFNYLNFVESYLKFCMNFSDETVNYFMSNASTILQYIVEVSGLDRAPESSGVFVLTCAA